MPPLQQDLFEIVEPKPNTQHSEILRALRSGYKLTPLDGLRLAKTFKLSSRVGELRKMGHSIKSEMVEVESGKRVMMYWM